MLLVCGKQKLETTPEHAQSLLYIQKQMKLKGWELPSSSPYEFKDNALIKRADTKNCTGEKKSKRSSARPKAPRKTEVSRRNDAE